MLIDAHQHYWDPALVEYPWMDPGDPVIHRGYGPDDLEPHLARHGIDGTVLVQSADSDEDTDSMFAVADAHPHVWGIVAFVPLDDPQRTSDRLEELRARPRFSGIRSLIHDRADPDWLLRPEVIESLRLLEAAAVPFDLVAVRPRHLEVLLAVREAVPGLRVVIDHLAKPPFDDGPDAPWHSLIARVAALPGVHAKLSGLYPELVGAAADLRPWIDRALELFGPERLMLGSDWPIAELAGGFDPVWERLVRHVDDLDETAASQLRAGTALRFYGLEPRQEDQG